MRNPKAEQGKFQSFIQGAGDEKQIIRCHQCYFIILPKHYNFDLVLCKG